MHYYATRTSNGIIEEVVVMVSRGRHVVHATGVTFNDELTATQTIIKKNFSAEETDKILKVIKQSARKKHR
jgi:hypothetical protein